MQRRDKDEATRKILNTDGSRWKDNRDSPKPGWRDLVKEDSARKQIYDN